MSRIHFVLSACLASGLAIAVPCDPLEAIGMHGFLTVRGGTAGASAKSQ